MYTTVNFPTKKALKEAIAAGREIGVFQPNNMFGQEPPTSGTATVEGPHYPKPHRWYARVTLEDGRIVKVQ
jgi:hypothetical protein